jgi:hypothetical protein
MTPESQNIAVAEFRGWKWEPRSDGDMLPWLTPDGCRYPKTHDYGQDLNAMHEAETMLNLEQSTEYVNLLWPQGYAPFAAVHASASKRREMLLKAVGQWKEAA